MLARIASIAILSLTVIMVAGLVPARATNLRLHSSILIQSNSDFTDSNGVTGGSGTAVDPYVIKGWRITGDIRIVHTNAYFAIEDLSLQNGGVYFGDVDNGQIENATITAGQGIALEGSQNVTIADNIVRSNFIGIDIAASRYVTVVGNDVSSNADGGIFVTYSNTCVAAYTVVNAYPNCGNGDIVVSGNLVGNNGFGISEIRRCTCFAIGNTLSNNSVGMVVNGAGDCCFHNNFINNTIQAVSGCPYEPCVTLWDDGYPSGGNFWSDYTGVDHCTGSDQNVCPAPDGLGDTPYFTGSSLAAVGIDRFPLMKPFAPLVSGTVLFETATITSESQGTYLTAVIGLPQGFNASNLIPSSIRLNQTLVALRVTQVTQLSKAPILIAKFNMTQVKALLSNPGLYVLKIRGNILTSKSFRPFEATSTIRLLPT